MNRRPQNYILRMSFVAKGFKTDRQRTDGISIGSSDALGFGNSKRQDSAPSAPDDPMP
jgi:hypothetical protein